MEPGPHRCDAINEAREHYHEGQHNIYDAVLEHPVKPTQQKPAWGVPPHLPSKFLVFFVFIFYLSIS